MTYSQVLKHYGTQAAIAAALGIGQSAVSQWRKAGVPFVRQMQLAAISPLKPEKAALRFFGLL